MESICVSGLGHHWLSQGENPLPVPRHVFTLTNAGLLSLGPLENRL